jgi:AcrR family transcriptional regulator
MNNKEIPEKIKERLYPKVLKLFSENDFHQVNIRDISKRSDISVGTLYKYFESKENLLFTAIEEYLSELRELMRQHIGGIENPKEIFRKIFWVTMDFYDRHPGVAIAAFITVPTKTLMQENAYRRDDLKEIFTTLHGRLRAQRSIDPALDLRSLNSLYFMFTARHINVWYYHGMKWKLSERIGDFFELFWKILDPPGK